MHNSTSPVAALADLRRAVALAKLSLSRLGPSPGGPDFDETQAVEATRLAAALAEAGLNALSDAGWDDELEEALEFIQDDLPTYLP